MRKTDDTDTDAANHEWHGTGTETHRYVRDTVEPSSHAVVSAVADALGREPLELEPLYHRVDPEALDGLVDRSYGAARPADTFVRFGFAGCAVVVSTEDVRVSTDGRA